MDTTPVKTSFPAIAFTVADFVKAGGESLCLTLAEGGDGLKRIVEQPLVSRPGLALTGFYEHFEGGRLQLVGNAEAAYLKSLDARTRKRRIEAIFKRGTFCVICTNGEPPHRDLVSLARSHGVVLLTSTLETRHFMHRSAYVLDSLGAPRMKMYATMVEVAGLGVLIDGDPGLGKSETALGLVKRGNSLVADDLTCIRRDTGSNRLYCSASSSTAGFIEIRGLGIMNIRSIFGVNAVCQEKELQLSITFKRLSELHGEIDRVGQSRKVRTILGVQVPHVIIPVSEGRDLVSLVETAAQRERLHLAGYDAVDELSEHLRRRADAFLSQDDFKGREGKNNGR